MSEQQFTDFFDPEIQKIVSEDGCSIYRMKNVTGEGVITRYEILPGIELFYNDFHMSDGQNQNKLPHSDVLEINHCREGRFECEFANGDYQYVGAGDLAINRLTNETTSTYFPLSHYHGISITIDLPTADQTMKRIESVIGGLNIDVFSIADKFCKNDTCIVLRTQSEIEHIFSELYRVEPRMIAYYLKVKVLELLMFLNQVSLQDYQEERRYFARNQVQTIKKMQEYMTADLRNHYTLQELSEKFEIPLTSMKVCFKGVYGCSIYAYMKSYRMQAATILLRDTSDSITEIAAKMGYDIIILDEATSSVDPENENLLMGAIAELTKNKTVIMIAHRLKTVRNADQIFVLSGGHIVQTGKHEDLIRQPGIYADFIGIRKKAIGWKLK